MQPLETPAAAGQPAKQSFGHALLALCAAALLAGCASGPVDERTPQPRGWADCKRNPYCSSLTGPQWDHRKHTPPYPLPTLPAAAARDQGQGSRAQR